MINADDEVSLAYLLEPTFQIENTAGKPLTGGYIEVYLHGTRTKYYCYSDWNGTLHPFKIPLDSLGSNIILASPAHAYDIYVYNKYGTLVMSRYNVVPVTVDGVIIKDVEITGTDGSVKVDRTEVPNGVQYDLSVNTDIIKDVEITGTDGSVKVDRTEVPNGVQYDLSVNTEKIATKDEIINKQDQLTPGNNIIITDNIISATGIPTKTSELVNDSGFVTNDWKTLNFSKNPKYANYINHNYVHVRYSLSMRILMVEGWFSLSSSVYINTGSGLDWDPLLILPASDDIKLLPNSFSVVTKDNTFKECSTADLPIRGLNFRINQTISSGFYNLITICTNF